MTIEEVEQGLGLLLSSGWTLDECLDLSWTQLAICIRCVVRVKTEQATMIMETIAVAMGGKVKNKKKRKQSQQPNTSSKRKESKEDQFLRSIAAAGVPVHTVETPSS